MRVADHIWQELSNLGIRDCFVLAGGASGHLLDALSGQSRIKPHFFYHEQSCAMACDAYFRFHQRPAALLVTNGPGVSNTVTGILGAYQDSIPVFCISGQVPQRFISTPQSNLRQLGVQESFTEELIGSISKSFMRLTSNRLQEVLKGMWGAMMDGRMGPVWLEVPLDIQASSCSGDSLGFEAPTKLQPSGVEASSLGKKVSKLFALIESSKKPLAIIGNGVHLSGTETEAIEFLKRMGLPFLATWSAADIVDFDHPNYIGNFGILGERSANFAVQEADFLLILGSRLSVPSIGYQTELFSPKSRKVMVDIDESELNKSSITIDVPILCDLRDFFHETAPFSSPFTSSSWLDGLRLLKEEVAIEHEPMVDGEGGVDAYRVISYLSKDLDLFDAVVTDMGTSFTATMQAVRRNGKTRVMTSSGTSSMGFGLPGALGIALTERSAKVLAIVGDGGLMMNIQEAMVWSKKAENLKVLVLDSDGYLAISLMQKNLFEGRLIGSDSNSGVGSPNFAAVFEAFGLRSIACSDAELFPSAWREFTDSQGPTAMIVSLPRDQAMRPRVQTFINADGIAESPTLDKMWPII